VISLYKVVGTVEAYVLAESVFGATDCVRLLSDDRVAFSGVDASIADPLTAFNELLVAEPLPRVQIDAAYGLLTTDIETRTSLSGAATAANALFDVQTGTTAGAYAVLSLNWHEE
jgi:hypothetical protein